MPPTLPARQMSSLQGANMRKGWKQLTVKFLNKQKGEYRARAFGGLPRSHRKGSRQVRMGAILRNL